MTSNNWLKIDYLILNYLKVHQLRHFKPLIIQQKDWGLEVLFCLSKEFTILTGPTGSGKTTFLS